MFDNLLIIDSGVNNRGSLFVVHMALLWHKKQVWSYK